LGPGKAQIYTVAVLATPSREKDLATLELLFARLWRASSAGQSARFGAVFLGLAGDAPPKVYRALARRIAINNIIFLAIFELLGAVILNFFGISLPIVQL